MNNKLLEYIESSFLSPLLKDEAVTDISYNGVSIFYVHNKEGRKKSSIKISPSEATDFIRQIANYSEKQFSFSSPILDVSIGRYRINATHSAIVRVENEKAISFDIRIGSTESRIKNDTQFMNIYCKNYLLDCLNNEKSIVIAGSTGSGKTELQKYLLSLLKPNSRVIVIDNIQELENLRSNEDLDLTSWQVSSNIALASFNELIRNALRNNPDWLIIAEARGKEMNEVLNSVMTGHPIITTIHARTIESVPQRIAKLILSADTTQKYEDILDDVKTYFQVIIFLKRVFEKDGKITRFIESIGEIDANKNLKIIYKK